MKHSKRRTVVYAFGLFGGLISLAVWGKMRFVTDLPRMAYAVPEEQEQQQAQDVFDTNTLHPEHESENETPQTGRD